MSHTIHIAGSGKYLVVVIKGPFKVDQACQFSVAARDMSRTSGIKRFLFDVRAARNTSNIIENYEFAYEHTNRMQLERNVHSAILVDPNDSSHDFVEITMRNAGFYVKLFRDEQAAINWLEE
jgi:hypothetical protein